MKKQHRLASATASLILVGTLIVAARQTAPQTSAPPQTGAPATAPASTPGVHPISGRRFAAVMGYQGAEWLDREERDIEEDPQSAIGALDLKRGMMVADIGAGTGYMSVLLAKKVAPTGTVYAEDIQPEMIELLRRRLAKEKITNITPVLGLTDDPKLTPQSLDLELLVDVYHEFSEPQKMLRGLRSALKSGGRLVLLEYRKEDPTIPIKLEHKMTVKEAQMEVEAEGFKLSKVDERLPRQHILIFTKP